MLMLILNILGTTSLIRLKAKQPKPGPWVLFPSQAELIDICRLVAESNLSEGKHQQALPAAQFCLRCSMDVHGSSAVQLVPAYLLLAESNMGEEGAHKGLST